MPDDAPVQSRIALRPVSDALGVEVVGLDLRDPIPGEVAGQLRAALAEHHLLLFRGQQVSAADQTRFAVLFGRIMIRKSLYKDVAKPEFADQQHVSNTRADGILGQGELTLHGDHFWTEAPLTALILYGMEVPDEGGETRFCASGRAYGAMPESLRRRIDPLRCVHMYDFRKADYTKPYDLSRIGQDGVHTATHPLVWHDAAGRPAIWLNATSTVGIEGLDAAEVATLSQELRAYLDAPAFNYSHRWREGDLVLWNNRMLLHARSPFDPGKARTLRRTPIL